jgi:hypothetical protein
MPVWWSTWPSAAERLAIERNDRLREGLTLSGGYFQPGLAKPVRIVVDGAEFVMDRGGLSNASGFFHTMFSWESAQQRGNDYIVLCEVEANVFAACASYITTGRCCLPSDDLLLPILRAAYAARASNARLPAASQRQRVHASPAAGTCCSSNHSSRRPRRR